MDLNYSEVLRRTFHLAALRRESDAIKTPRQWKMAKEIKDRCERVRDKEKRWFANCYTTRVEVARRRLVNKAGMKAKDFQHPWFVNDRFSPSDTLRQAQREVRDAHHRRIERINRIEERALESLVDQSMRENVMRGRAREAFGKAANRRLGRDRRQPGGPKRAH